MLRFCTSFSLVIPYLLLSPFLVSAKGFSKTQPVAELVSEVFRLRRGELENPARVRKLNWDKFVEVIKGIFTISVAQRYPFDNNEKKKKKKQSTDNSKIETFHSEMVFTCSYALKAFKMEQGLNFT